MSGIIKITMVRISKEKAAENRQAILDSAARGLRERGYDGLALADLMKEVGMTHGGFYNHFASKDALAAEACADAFTKGSCALEPTVEFLRQYIETRLTPADRDCAAGACPTSTLAVDAWRAGGKLQEAYADGLVRVLDAFTRAVGRTKALRTLSEMVGAMVLARGVGQANPSLSDEILAATRRGLRIPRRPRKRR
jgi:TetR/AcrR family transcriptional regulator, transcriptional repressor for nem operon